MRSASGPGWHGRRPPSRRDRGVWNAAARLKARSPRRQSTACHRPSPAGRTTHAARFARGVRLGSASARRRSRWTVRAVRGCRVRGAPGLRRAARGWPARHRVVPAEFRESLRRVAQHGLPLPEGDPVAQVRLKGVANVGDGLELRRGSVGRCVEAGRGGRAAANARIRASRVVSLRLGRCSRARRPRSARPVGSRSARSSRWRLGAAPYSAALSPRSAPARASSCPRAV